MDRFLVLRTVTDQGIANRVCAALEDAEIPVMLEHVLIQDSDRTASGFRILVPAQHTQKALSLVDRIEVSAYSNSYYEDASTVIH